MPQPNIRDLIVAGPLANVSIAYRNRSYIADSVFPIIDKVSPKAKIARYLKGAWFRDEARVRAAGTRAVRGGYPTDYVDINTKEYAFAKEVTDEDRRAVKVQGGPPLQPDQDAIEFCADKIDLSKERRVAELVLGGTWSGVAGEDAEGGWAAGSGNTFIEDVETRIETIRSGTGFRPNMLMLTANTLKELKMESTVLDRIKYTQRGVVTAALIAALLGLDEVIIGDAIYSTEAEKADGSDFSAQDIWEKNSGKRALLFCITAHPGRALRSPRPGIRQGSLMKTDRSEERPHGVRVPSTRMFTRLQKRRISSRQAKTSDSCGMTRLRRRISYE